MFLYGTEFVFPVYATETGSEFYKRVLLPEAMLTGDGDFPLSFQAKKETFCEHESLD